MSNSLLTVGFGEKRNRNTRKDLVAEGVAGLSYLVDWQRHGLYRAIQPCTNLLRLKLDAQYIFAT